MGAWRNSTETQQSGHAPRSRPEVKNGRSGSEDGAKGQFLPGNQRNLAEKGVVRKFVSTE